MKLPISLLAFAALGQALSLESATKRSEAKSLEAKSPTSKSPVTKSPVTKSPVTKKENTTSKRELYEGNYGERNQDLSQQYEVTRAPPAIMYIKDLKEERDHSPGHQMFGMRLPTLVKISDVLSQQGQQGPGSFEAAVAKHLYSPISVYQTRHSSPTSFEVPVPAASQSAYSNPKLYKLQKSLEKEHLQDGAPKAVNLPSPPEPLYTVNQPRLHFEAFPQALDHSLPREIFRQQIIPRKHMSSLIPIYDQIGPFRYPGQVVPSQYLHQNGLFQIIPLRKDPDFGNQEDSRDKNYPKQENQEQSQAGRPQPPIDVPVSKQGYHAHPNGAISFASFSQNFPFNKQYEVAQQQQQSEIFHQSQRSQSQSQPNSVQLPQPIGPQVALHSQEQKAQLKQNLQLAPMFLRLIQDLQNYQPVFQQQPQFIPYKQQIQNQPRPLNALQHHLLYQDPRQPVSNPQIIPFQRLPKFKPLPQSLMTSESFLQQTSRSPVITGQPPRPFSFEYQSTPTPENFLVQPVSTQHTPLPPLKTNYSKYVRPLEPQSHTTPVFLPTPLQPLQSSTPKQEPLSDQLISSTTVQPNVNDQEDSEKHQIHEETKTQSQTSQPLNPEIIHQSEPTARPLLVQSTTYLPFVTHEPQSNYIQHSTPQPQYQSTIRPQSPSTQPPRHDVVIQRQEIQELFFEPSPQPPQPSQHSGLARYQSQRTQVAPQYERELINLRTQPHQLFEQLQPYPDQHELQDIHTQQYLVEARQSYSQQQPISAHYRQPQQYEIQQHSHPVELLQFQPTLLQSLQPELQQSPYQQQVSKQAQQQQHGFLQIQQQQGLEQTQQQQNSVQTEQHGSEHSQQQQQESEHSQQQHESEQAQQQHDGSEQTQQQHEGTEQTQQLQYQEHLDSNNQIQISTLRPSEDTEKQTETVEIPLQPESQTTTGKPNGQPEPSSEHAPTLEEPHLGPILNPSTDPQIYAHPQHLAAQPIYSPLAGVPPYSDVQYYGKFAESIFGKRHH